MTILGKLVQFALPNYGKSENLTKADTEGGTLDVAAEVPTTRSVLSGGLAEWPDDVFDINNDGYALLRRCPPIVAAMRKRGTAVAKLDWTVEGGNEERRKFFRKVFDASVGWVDYFRWMEWAHAEGYRVYQIKKIEDEEQGVVAADWRLGGRRKWKAGPNNGKGTVAWDGNNLNKVQDITTVSTNGITERQPDYAPEALNRDEFVIFRPGGGSNPEGDMELPLVLYDIAKDWDEGRKNAGKYVEIYGVPMRGYEKNVDKMKSSAVSGVLTALAAKVDGMKAGSSVAMPTGDSLKLFQPTGRALLDLWDHLREHSGMVWLLLLDSKLTQDTADSGPTGSSKVGLSEKDAAMLVAAMEQAEALNSDFVPWVIENNPDAPPLAEGETECYFWPQPPASEDAGEMDGEGGDGEAEGEEGEPDPMEEEPVDPRSEQMFLQDTLRAVTYNEITKEAALYTLRKGELEASDAELLSMVEGADSLRKEREAQNERESAYLGANS